MMKKYILIAFLTLTSVIVGQDFNQDSLQIKNMSFNSKNSDFGVAYYKDSAIVFASARSKRGWINRKWRPNNQPYLNLYTLNLDSTSTKKQQLKDTLAFTKENKKVDTLKVKKKKKSKKVEELIASFSDEINTKFHESSVAFTNDFSTVYFTRDRFLDGALGKPDASGKVVLNLYKATNVNGSWSNIQQLPFNSHLYSTGHPALSKDNKTLYFISDMPGGLGSTDLYKVQISNDSTYSKPINLGKKVNTSGNEMFPFVDENNVLYFSSNGQENTMGNLDIYAIKQDTLNKFEGELMHFNYPLNSIDDDFAFVKEKGKNEGYFSSNRYGGVGDDDIYSFKGLKIKKDCKSNVVGVVLDKNSKQIIPNATVVVYDSTKKVYKQLVSDEKGTFAFLSKCKTQYKIEASKDGYEKTIRTITTQGGELKLEMDLNEVKKVDILLEKDVNIDDKGRMLINIENIYYNTNKYDIRPSERPKLNRLIQLMNKYPDIIVEIGAFTDCRGRASYNLKLSDNRAKSAREYVVRRGIAPNRIFGRGYGETKPVNDCDCSRKCTQEAYQENRRTEFLIVNK